MRWFRKTSASDKHEAWQTGRMEDSLRVLVESCVLWSSIMPILFQHFHKTPNKFKFVHYACTNNTDEELFATSPVEEFPI